MTFRAAVGALCCGALAAPALGAAAPSLRGAPAAANGTKFITEEGFGWLLQLDGGNSTWSKIRLASGEGVSYPAYEPPSPAGDKYVVGGDDRYKFNPAVYPDSTVGQLLFSRSACTATLIGPSLILSAAHCFASWGFQSSDASSAVFALGRMGQLARAQARLASALLGTFSPETNPGQDWAIAKLTAPIGQSTGFMGIDGSYIQPPQYKQFGLIAYSEDGYIDVAGKDPACSITGIEGQVNMYRNDCDGNHGASGGAMYRTATNQIVAVFVAAHPDGQTNLATRAGNFAGEIGRLGR